MPLRFDKNAGTFYLAAGDNDLSPQNVFKKWKSNPKTPKNAWKICNASLSKVFYLPNVVGSLYVKENMTDKSFVFKTGKQLCLSVL